MVCIKITVLRLGHRLNRDYRLSSHVGLVARAFGAAEIVVSGEKDPAILKSLRDVVKKWGGPFAVKYEKNFRKVIKNFRGKKILLSMYGLPIQKTIKNIRGKKNLLIVVGAEKVPAELYQLVDLNVAVTSQPHSEAAALAIFLHELLKGKELGKKFKRAKARVIPQEKGKKVVKNI